MSRSRGASFTTFRSSIRIAPSSTCSRPASIRRIVVFPQPEGPTRTRNSPSATWRFRSSTTGSSPNSLWTPSYRTSANWISQLRNRCGRDCRASAVRSRLENGHRVVLDPLMVELEAEPGPVGDLDATVGVDPRWVDEHLVAGSGGPAAARVVRKLKPVARRDRRGEVQIRNEADPVRPGVRYDAEMRRLRERGHLPELE